MNDYTALLFFAAAVALGLAAYGVASLWAALRINATTDWLLAVDGTDEEDDGPLYPRMSSISADGDDYTYTQREETLRITYDMRTDERIEALEDAVRKLARRIEALENRP